MWRKYLLSIMVLGFLACQASAQEWARRMFKQTEHDFGVVARGAKAEFRFEFENIYLEDVHISGAYSSCGCTSVRVENPLVKTYESGAIVAHYNTDAFTGARGATIVVNIDKPYPATVQLHVRGFVRGDVELEPGSVQFGTVEQGNEAEQSVRITCAGGWQVLDVKNPNPSLKAELTEVGRFGGRQVYELKVRLSKDTPSGYLNEHLLLTTNDPRGTPIAVAVEGRVTGGEIAVSPPALFLGVVEPGGKVTRQLVLKGNKPFRVLNISCDDESFQFDLSQANEPKTLHLIPVTFTAGTELGKVVKTIRIKTDHGYSEPQLSAYAVVAAK